MKKTLTALSIALSSLLTAITPEQLSKYPNPIFIESGTFLGDGTKAALQAGFSEVHTIELSYKYYEKARRTFRGEPRVRLHFGESPIVLQKLLPTLQTTATFWLDAHFSGGITAYGEILNPVLYELELISQHPIKTHTILVGELHLLKEGELEKVIEGIRAINPKYEISYEDGVQVKDILVAKV